MKGNAGSGKSTVAARLGESLGREVIGLDSIVWGPGWSRPPADERDAAIHAIAEAPTWLVDGVSMVLCESADVIVFLDMSRSTCYWRVFWRNLPFLFRSRPGLPENCPEVAIIGTLVKIIWQFPTLVRPRIAQEMARRNEGESSFHIRSRGDLDEFFVAVEARLGD